MQPRACSRPTQRGTAADPRAGGGSGAVARRGARAPPSALALPPPLECVAERLRRQRGTDVRSDWSRGLSALLSDREALAKATADPARPPRGAPGTPPGMA